MSMKTLCCLIAFAGLMHGCQSQKTEPEKQEEGFIKNVNATEFKKLSESGEGITLDVRTPEEIAQGQIANSSSIDFYDKKFEDRINLMPKDKAIYVYCKAGGRSAEAASLLKKNGFKAIYNLTGGITAWEQAGLPLEKTSNAVDEKIQELSLRDFEKIIQEESLVLVDFHTVWCSPCRKMAPIIDDLEQAYLGKAKIMRVDLDKSKELAKAYNIVDVPVFILFENGKEVWKHRGIISEEDLRHQLDRKP